MSTQEATPRPWAVIGAIVYANAARTLSGGTEQPAVAQCGTPGERTSSFIDDRYSTRPEAVRAANAALIVEAVNSYDALRAACEAALECLEPTDDPQGRTNRVIKQLRSALGEDK